MFNANYSLQISSYLFSSGLFLKCDLRKYIFLRVGKILG